MATWNSNLWNRCRPIKVTTSNSNVTTRNSFRLYSDSSCLQIFKWCYSEVSKYLGMPLSIFNGICDYTVKCLSELPIWKHSGLVNLIACHLKRGSEFILCVCIIISWKKKVGICVSVGYTCSASYWPWKICREFIKLHLPGCTSSSGLYFCNLFYYQITPLHVAGEKRLLQNSGFS